MRYGTVYCNVCRHCVMIALQYSISLRLSFTRRGRQTWADFVTATSAHSGNRPPGRDGWPVQIPVSPSRGSKPRDLRAAGSSYSTMYSYERETGSFQYLYPYPYKCYSYVLGGVVTFAKCLYIRKSEQAASKILFVRISYRCAGTRTDREVTTGAACKTAGSVERRSDTCRNLNMLKVYDTDHTSFLNMPIQI